MSCADYFSCPVDHPDFYSMAVTASLVLILGNLLVLRVGRRALRPDHPRMAEWYMGVLVAAGTVTFGVSVVTLAGGIPSATFVRAGTACLILLQFMGWLIAGWIQVSGDVRFWAAPPGDVPPGSHGGHIGRDGDDDGTPAGP